MFCLTLYREMTITFILDHWSLEFYFNPIVDCANYQGDKDEQPKKNAKQIVVFSIHSVSIKRGVGCSTYALHFH